ncbi:MAG TPA: redoxin family protein, partial [Thermoleophilaceae bacterium]|nr:redoxin family protein [Thermoleophilaceae bacterium]
MLLLTLFAVVAGAATAVTPCVLPVLPALLSASAVGGRRRPVGIVLGLALTFTIAVVALASLVKGVGVAGNGVRVLAEVVLIGFGISLLLPGVSARIEAPLSRLSRFGPRTRGDGFWSGVGVGGALGFAYTPCAGPILAAVISVSATQGTSARLVTIALAYAAGSALVLLVLALGGRKVADRIRAAGRGLGLQRAMGVVMVLTAVAMATMVDVKLENALAQHLPTALIDPANSIETSHPVQSRLASLRGKPRFDSTRPVAHGPAGKRPADGLPVLGKAPDFASPGPWLNTGGKRLTLASLRGRVVLVDFWTYTCINCIRTFPYLKAWDARYRKAGLTIVGVHTPEFPFEHDTGNVKHAIASDGIRYPVVQDNNYGTWTAWGNQYWPAEYLIDARGRVRYTHFGEGDYAKDEEAIRTLLAERGDKRLANGLAKVHAIKPPRLATPETYVGTARAEGYTNGPVKGVHDYGPPPNGLGLNQFAYGGVWNETKESGTAVRSASLNLDFQAQRVYVVLGPPPGRSALVQVLLNGKPIPRGSAG